MYFQNWALDFQLSWILWKTFEDLQKKNIAIVLQAFEAEGKSEHFVWLECK